MHTNDPTTREIPELDTDVTHDSLAEHLHAALVEFIRACGAEPPELVAAVEFFERENPKLKQYSLQRAAWSVSVATTEDEEQMRMAADEIHAVLVRHFAYYGHIPPELERAADYLERQGRPRGGSPK